MKLNKGHWNLWKQSEKGKAAIRLFEDVQVQDLFDKYIRVDHFDSSESTDYVNNLLDFAVTRNVPEDFLDYESETFFDWIISGNVVLADEEGELEFNDPPELLARIPEISTWLYLLCPDFYKPYFFYNEFHLLTRIADTFGLELPVVPLKRYKSERFKYYWHLCNEFSKFQEENELTAAEFCAFLYDFAPDNISQNDKKDLQEMPLPSQVWMVGANKAGGDFEFLDNFSEGDTHSWQGNEDTKKGDILVMYCLAPYSYVHSIWRATTDGIADPFFHWYGSIYIGEGQKVTPITLNELKSDSYFSHHPLVRKNLQGVNGYQLKTQDYSRLLDMIVEKGVSTADLPQLDGYTIKLDKILVKKEEDVENLLIEPLLAKLGYVPSDWVRQLTVRMGRGERNFPDYAFLARKERGAETASMLIESKFYIKNKREMDDAFEQVRSYGLRLSAKILVIVDRDSLWIYQREKDSFDRTNYLKKFWYELENADDFALIKKLIGKKIW